MSIRARLWSAGCILTVGCTVMGGGCDTHSFTVGGLGLGIVILGVLLAFVADMSFGGDKSE